MMSSRPAIGSPARPHHRTNGIRPPLEIGVRLCIHYDRVRVGSGKAASNAVKHGVRFASAVQVFYDGNAITAHDDPHVEERFVTIGLDELGRVLVVVWCWRGEQ